MRKNFQLRNALMLMGLASMPLWFASCSDEENIPAPGTEPTNPEIEAAFDFKMTTDLPVKIDYPSFAKICVYDQLPDGTNNARLLFRSYTGANGTLETVNTFPTAYIGKTVYVFAEGANCPTWQEATLTENGLEIKAEGSRFAANTESDYSITDMINLRSSVLHVLPDDDDNLHYVQDHYTSGINIDTHIDGLNNTYPTAHIKVTFVNAQGWNYNTLYYYTYTQEDLDAGRINIDFVLAQQNDDHLLFGPYSNYSEADESLHPNQYVNKTVVISDDQDTPTEFKNGDYIGFLLVSKSYDSNHTEYYYTSQESTRNRVGQAASFTYRNEALVYTFEDEPVYNDWGFYNRNKDFNDFTFVVKANPEEAIENPDIPDLKEPPFYNISVGEPYEGTLLFEDNYPEAGDYDMNDFVTTFALTPVRRILYDPNTDTPMSDTYYLDEIRYSFTPKWDGAWYGCSFYFMLDGLKNDPTHVYTMNANQTMGALSVEPITGTIDLGFEYKDDELTGNQYEASKYPMDKVFNPFITTTNNGYEIHLPGYKASAGADLEGLTDWQKAYKLEDKKHPFAANVPIPDYKVVTEQMKIDDFYPKFGNWVDTEGKEDTDWYNHPYPAQ